MCEEKKNGLTVENDEDKIYGIIGYTADNLHIISEGDSDNYISIKQEKLKLCKICECYVCPSCEKAHLKDSLTNERIPRWNANIDTIHCYCEKCFDKFALDMTHDPVL